jgi:hypothetical protein
MRKLSSSTATTCICPCRSIREMEAVEHGNEMRENVKYVGIYLSLSIFLPNTASVRLSPQ